jgi:hypothetical protein
MKYDSKIDLFLNVYSGCFPIVYLLFNFLFFGLLLHRFKIHPGDYAKVILNVDAAFLLFNFPILDYCYTDIKFIPVIIKIILNVHSGCFHTISSFWIIVT